jgi:hypothetical protein
MATRRPRRWILVTALLFLAALAQRAWNLVRYPIGMGFDADGNWDYIALLLADWRLPAPGEGWSMAHPPFFYALGAFLGRAMGETGMEEVGRATIAASSLLGLAAIGALAHGIRRTLGGDERRVAIATALLLFLPVHVYTSAMLGEEILTTALVTFSVVGLMAEFGRADSERSDLLRPALFGAVAGLALLTKMSAVLAVAASCVVLLAEGPRRGWTKALGSTLSFGLAASVVGGWFYLHNLATYGYLYPHGLPVHALMFEMPPGVRSLSDYLRIPAAAFGPAQASDADLLHSVWGSLWASIWFDTHRAFVPLHPTKGLRAAAHLLLVLGLVPAAAFVTGLVRGARRAVVEASGPDRLLVALTAALLAGFVAFTWQNPWFASIKGGYLLGLSAPYAVYASETMQRWMRDRPWSAWPIGAVLATLCLVTAVTFSYNLRFVKMEYPGTEWRDVPR